MAKNLGLHYSLKKFNYVYTVQPGEVSGPILQTHKLGLLHTISSTGNLATCEPRVILHNTEQYFPPSGRVCFRLQSDSFRRLLLGQQYHQRRTPSGCTTSRSAQQHRLGTCSHGTGHIWRGGRRRDLAPADVIYS